MTATELIYLETVLDELRALSVSVSDRYARLIIVNALDNLYELNQIYG